MTPHLDALFRCLPAGVVLLDRDGKVVAFNEAAGRLARRSSEQALGSDFFHDVLPAADLGAGFRKAMDDAAAGPDSDLDFAFAPEGELVDVRIRMRKLQLDGAPMAILVLDDNSRLKRAERTMSAALTKAEKDAIRDPLTGLFNRRYVQDVLPGELSRAQRYAVPLSVLVVDVDFFKKVNDRFGHPVGDRVLLRLAEVMQRMRRVSDTCARLGGEEFCVVLPHVGPEGARAAADRLHRVIRALRFEEEPELRVTVSIGTATTPTPITGEEFEKLGHQLLARADEALYAAKGSGRDRTVVREQM